MTITNTKLDKAAPTLLDRKQLSTRWTTSIATLKRLEKAGKINPLLISERVIRYRVSDIEAIEEGGSI